MTAGKESCAAPCDRLPQDRVYREMLGVSADDLDSLRRDK